MSTPCAQCHMLMEPKPRQSFDGSTSDLSHTCNHMAKQRSRCQSHMVVNLMSLLQRIRFASSPLHLRSLPCTILSMSCAHDVYICPAPRRKHECSPPHVALDRDASVVSMSCAREAESSSVMRMNVARLGYESSLIFCFSPRPESGAFSGDGSISILCVIKKLKKLDSYVGLASCSFMSW